MWVHQEKTRLNIAVNSNKDLFQAWQNVQIPYPFLASGILPAGLIQPEDFRAKHLTGTGHPLISFNFNILKNQEGLTRGCNLQLGHRTFAQQRGKKTAKKTEVTVWLLPVACFVSVITHKVTKYPLSRPTGQYTSHDAIKCSVYLNLDKGLNQKAKCLSGSKTSASYKMLKRCLHTPVFQTSQK